MLLALRLLPLIKLPHRSIQKTQENEQCMAHKSRMRHAACGMWQEETAALVAKNEARAHQLNAKAARQVLCVLQE